jgi:hypothetical protein
VDTHFYIAVSDVEALCLVRGPRYPSPVRLSPVVGLGSM